MLATITNLDAVNTLDVPAPFGVTLGAAGADTLPIRLRDLHAISDKDRSNADRIRDLVKEGKMTISFAVEPESTDPEEVMLAASLANAQVGTLAGKNTQSGVVTFGASASESVVLATAFADDTYVLLVTPEGADDAPFIANKAVGGFDIDFGAVFTGTVSWMAFAQ